LAEPGKSIARGPQGDAGHLAASGPFPIVLGGPRWRLRACGAAGRHL